jgi:hypothetical protein
MGTVAERSRMAHVKSILSVEMIVQTLKKIYFCNAEYNLGTMKECLVDFLNMVFTSTPDGYELFVQIVYPDILDYYDYNMEGYPPKIPGGGLLHAVCYHFGVDIKILDYPFFMEPQERLIFSNGNVGEFIANS